MTPHTPKKSYVHHTSEDEDIIVYDIDEDEREQFKHIRGGIHCFAYNGSCRAVLFASAAAADFEITHNIPTPDPRKRLMEPGEIAGLNKTLQAPVENVKDKQPKETDERSGSAKEPEIKSFWQRWKKFFSGLKKK
ncbi:hypothetical protein TNIN_387031 [Trichonephila inaurata madagascariensis]|uniref:Uncharacterized protein n=1 Tax=Trichonephila inaurata madagascariensis TaxID=2747483 RepID=A0A8X6X757_9ARAC|nr:hypothetical protein TNIN_387031 [Trichonephila inaurata madagascariensis]